MAKFETSVPGRTEVAGNHQDHQAGCVIAAAVDRRIKCVAEPADGSTVSVETDCGAPFVLDMADPDFCEIHESEYNTTEALVRGMASGLMKAGFEIPGCRLKFESDIPLGMGLSSSAAFELCAGGAMACLAAAPDAEFDESGLPLDLMDLARMALVAEREYFGKPSGILDQTACALGGVNHLDFSDVKHPIDTRIELPASWNEYANLIVDCGSGHESTTDDFAQVANEMREAAECLGLAHLGDIEWSKYVDLMDKVRAERGDRVALRGFHFYNELDLVERRWAALLADDMCEFVRLTNRSAASSAEYLHNVSMPTSSQPAMVALALCSMVLEQLAEETGCPYGSARIHGGGFGGTIQVFVPAEHADEFERRITRLMKRDCCMRIKLGEPGITARRID